MSTNFALDALSDFSLELLLLGFGLAALVSILAWRFGLLAGSGAIAATIIGGLIFSLGRLPWALLLLTFFVSSSLLSWAFPSRKREVASTFAKGGRRDWAQVAANGGLGTCFLLAVFLGWIDPSIAWAGYAGSLASVNADTWATELGVLSPTPPRLLTTGKRVLPGKSGGISLLGSMAALAGAFLIAGLAGWFTSSQTPQLVLIVTLAGLLGSFVDSLFGATVQAIYYCPQCKKETERHPFHTCGTPTIFHRGWVWLNNDGVNFFSSVFGALSAAGAFYLLMR